MGHHAVRCNLLQNSPQRQSRRSVPPRKARESTELRPGGTRFVVSAEVAQEVLGIDGGRFAWAAGKNGFPLRSACPERSRRACPACRAVAYSRRRERSRREPPEKATLSGGIRQTDRQTDRRKRCAKWPRFAISYTISEHGLQLFHLPPPDGGGDMPILKYRAQFTLFRIPSASGILLP